MHEQERETMRQVPDGGGDAPVRRRAGRGAGARHRRARGATWPRSPLAELPDETEPAFFLLEEGA